MSEDERDAARAALVAAEIAAEEAEKSASRLWSAWYELADAIREVGLLVRPYKDDD